VAASGRGMTAAAAARMTAATATAAMATTAMPLSDRR